MKFKTILLKKYFHLKYFKLRKRQMNNRIELYHDVAMAIYGDLKKEVDLLSKKITKICEYIGVEEL